MSSDRRHLSLPVVSRSRHCDEPDVPHPDEFRPGASAWDPRFSRRAFMQTMGASLALAGAYGCSDKPKEAIVPYVDQPEQIVPGEPLFFATALLRSGYARGVIVQSHEGRPTKIEGNPDHPASHGAADVSMQAAVLSLYDTKRSQTVTLAGEPVTWGAFVEAFKERVHEDGAGVGILTGAITSPALIDQLDRVLRKYPKAKRYTAEAIDRANARAGAQSALGQPYEPIYHIDQCDVIVSLDSDFLWDEPGSLTYARHFADGRRVRDDNLKMSRLYVAESAFSLTGTKADHRLPVQPAEIAQLANALLQRINGENSSPLKPAQQQWLDAAAHDLLAARGRSLIIVGESQPPEVHAVATAINAALGNLDQTIDYIAPVTDQRGGSLADLMRDLSRDDISTLLIFSDNPVRRSPGDLALGDAIGKLSSVRNPDGSLKNFVVHHGLYANETTFVSQWHVPAQHTLETWGDARAYDGTISIIQPLIAPLYQGHAVSDVLGLMLGEPDLSAYETLRRYWRQQTKINQPDAFDQWWNRALQRGVIENTASPRIKMSATATPMLASPKAIAGLQLVLRPDYSIWDGCDFNNPWLQELPRPLTKIVWGNAAIMSFPTARRHGLHDDDVVRLSVDQHTLEAPVLVSPGVADDVIVLHLGYGQHKIVSNATAVDVVPDLFGVNAYRLRMAGALWTTPVTLEKIDRTEHVVRTHNHHAMAVDTDDPSVKSDLTPQVVATPETSDDDLKLHNRKLIRAATLAQRKDDPDFVRKMNEKVDSLYNTWDYSKGQQWGMSIDLTTCIGCNACIVACQAENNIPVVGPDQVDREREMHWIRIDNYVGGPEESPRVYHQPVPCMHCENAPCEYVCPVGATSHSVDGLNQMTYNRCVGTRYCSNNCPYKVRRFNFFNYTAGSKNEFGMQRNPNVTVRSRGVMEKCSYCVQRIVYARRKTEIAQLNAEANGATDDVVHPMMERLQTACQQTCPTNAIVFGDIRDPKSKVAALKADPMNYGLLEELTTKPRTTYLAHLSNPNPALTGGGGAA